MHVSLSYIVNYVLLSVVHDETNNLPVENVEINIRIYIYTHIYAFIYVNMCIE